MGHGGTRTAVAAVAGTAAATGAMAALSARPPGGADLWERTNHRGEPVSLLAGPALAIGASVGAAVGAPTVVAGATALGTGLLVGGLGVYDDIVGSSVEQRSSKGFRGHLGALRRGQVTTGLVKIVGIGATGVLAAASVGRSGSPSWAGRRGALVALAYDVTVSGGVVAGTANLFNLLDLRPGRAIKAGAVLGVPMLPLATGGSVAGVLGASAAMLPADLSERTMLGDGGANAMGALLGLALVGGTGRLTRTAAFVGIAGLTLASEKVSFTSVIESTPGLREVDAWGRRPRA